MTVIQMNETITRPRNKGQTLRNIVVATDFSPNATAALSWATELAQAHDATITVVHAIDTDLPALADAQVFIGRHVRQNLEMSEALLKACGVAARTEHQIGKPWKVIDKVANQVRADLIVLGTHGRTKLSERLLGTVADRLIRTTSIPVVAFRPREDESVRAPRTVLVATDFSEEAALATSTAVRLLNGSPEPARLVLFHSVALLIEYGNLEVPTAVPQYWDEAERTAARKMEALACSLRNDHLQVEVKTFRGLPVESILEQAHDIDADLIALGTQGRTRVNRFFMGSVAQQVLHQADCPVLLVRKPDPDRGIDLSVT